MKLPPCCSSTCLASVVVASDACEMVLLLVAAALKHGVAPIMQWIFGGVLKFILYFYFR